MLRLLEATGQIGVWSLDLRTGEKSGSAGLAHLTGLTQDESLHGLLDGLLHPDEREVHGDLFDTLYSGRAIDHTVRIVRPDRTVRWISVKAQIIVDADHRPARAEGVAFDVTGPHEARLLAEQVMARYRGIVHAIAAVVWTTSPDGRARPSPAWQALTGQSGSEMQGDGWLAAIHPEDRSRTEAVWRAALATTTPYEMKHRVLHADGTFAWFESRATPLCDPDGSVREWVGIVLKMERGADFASDAPSSLQITGPLIRGARAMLNWSVAELSAAAGVSVASIRRLEEEVATVRPRTRETVRRALEVLGIDLVTASDGRAGLMVDRLAVLRASGSHTDPAEMPEAASCPDARVR